MTYLAYIMSNPSKKDIKSHLHYNTDEEIDIKSVKDVDEIDSPIKDHPHFKGLSVDKKWLCICRTSNGKERIWVIYNDNNDRLLTSEQYKDSYSYHQKN